MSVLVDPDLSAPELRQSAYDGNVVILTTLRSVGSLVDHVREQLLDLYAPYEPEYAHEHIDKTEMAKLLDDWKPRFIHSPKSKELVRAIIREAGFPAGETHYDLPKPRTSFPAGHLTTGIADAFRSASRHLVQRTAGSADQLVAPGIPSPGRTTPCALTFKHSAAPWRTVRAGSTTTRTTGRG